MASASDHSLHPIRVVRARLCAIQYLRAAAAVGVVAFHTSWTHSVIGAAGVDVFFVISGFIMMHVSAGREGNAWTFARARIWRVVPLYWLVTLLALAIQPGLHGPREVVLSLLFIPYGGHGHISPVLIQGWTLTYEVFFYAIFTCCLFLSARHRLLLLTAALGTLMLANAILQPRGALSSIYTDPLLLEFLAGAWLCAATRRGFLLPYPAFAVVAGLLLFALQAGTPGPGAWMRPLFWGFPALLIVAGAVGLEERGRVPKVGWLVLAGDASYSIYLIHSFAFTAIRSALTALPATLALPLALAGCALAGILFYLVVERPLQLAPRRMRRAVA